MIKPILFNAEMVRAILDGRKTCTRRVVKKVPEGTYQIDAEANEDCLRFFATYGKLIEGGTADLYTELKPPYQVGDVLYVRETWQYLYELDGGENPIEGTERYYYAATDTLPLTEYVDQQGRTHDYIPWKPSIHMPKEAARIWLKVKDVQVERLYDITGKSVLREGINSHVHPDADYFDGNQREVFAELWNSTIKKSNLDRHGWEANPWVWVIEFERCENPLEVE